VQKLYRSENTDLGLVGTYGVEDLVITSENLKKKVVKPQDYLN
jgi:hypothetical protein